LSLRLSKLSLRESSELSVYKQAVEEPENITDVEDDKDNDEE